MSINCTNLYVLLYGHKQSDKGYLCYMNDHSVFGCVVLIFVLDFQSFLSIVVSFALLLSSKFYLVSLEVGRVLDNLTNCSILWNRTPTLQLAIELYVPFL